MTMTNNDLNQLFCLTREIKDMECRIREIEAQTTSVISTSPGTPSGNNKGSRENIAYADLTNALYDRLEALNEKRLQLLEFLDSVQESQIREAMMARYYDGLTWTQVACKMGGKKTPDSARKMCTRYITANCPADTL